ncbi:ATP-binding protein [Bradyrhizobium sp. Ash2021]|uniref:AlbA family DNA-binding domain-containing protein n=1 Tax=Bradyrhizobium sp. Ash2021 TaxID=2954771 RepID=UPI002815A604|nr:ATP-binding protein [Bradyrhizobium sp. Ash2021]WMT73942.1 ATP-binding protein [Bradyrhizobium sp. Ash2021]
MRPVTEWEESDLDELHRGEIMESLTLEYKDSRVLDNKVYQQGELFKDVSAFANSAGGILIFGMKESGHLPTGTDDGVDPSKIKREWLENILTSNIQPKIENLLIKQVILTSKATGNVAYVLDIPQAKSRSPHQGPEHKYYKRYNFKADPMEDYEVRDLMRRGIEYGRKYGAALDFYVEVARLCSASGARAAAGSASLDANRAIIGVSPDLRTAGSVLVLMSPYLRKSVAEMIMKVDAYNSGVEARGGVNIILDSSARDQLLQIRTLGDEICTHLQVILDQEP